MNSDDIKASVRKHLEKKVGKMYAPESVSEIMDRIRKDMNERQIYPGNIGCPEGWHETNSWSHYYHRAFMEGFCTQVELNMIEKDMGDYIWNYAFND